MIYFITYQMKIRSFYKNNQHFYSVFHSYICRCISFILKKILASNQSVKENCHYVNSINIHQVINLSIFKD